jgi:hypothetical protein
MLVQARCVINPDERDLPDELAHVFSGVRGRGILRTSPKRSSKKFVKKDRELAHLRDASLSLRGYAVIVTWLADAV